MNKRISTLLTSLFLALLLTQIGCSEQPSAVENDQANTGSVTTTESQKTTTPTSRNTSTSAGSSQFVSGVHYHELSNPLQVESTDGVEVLEVFWYGCQHCNASQPYVKRWEESKPAAAHLVRMPAPLSGIWSFHAQIFYTTQALGLEEKLHQVTFDAIHKRKLSFASIEKVAGYYSSNYGVDAEEYTKAFESFSVNLELQKATDKVQQAQINGVPAFIVAGKYIVNAESAGSTANIFSVINHLVEKVLNG